MRARVLALVLLSLVPTACGSGATVPPRGSTTEPPAQRVTAAAYFVREGRVAKAHVVVTRIKDFGPAATPGDALDALFDGPPKGFETDLAEDLGTFGLYIADKTAHLSLGSGSAQLSRLGRAQIVYTLTQFPTIERVSIDKSPPVTRADYEDETPIILVETPAPGDTVTSPIHVAGTANTFEATLQLRIVQDGKKLYEHFVTATSGSGQRGTFAWDIPIDATGPVTLEAFEYSAEDGSEIHKIEIPITLG